MHLYVGLDAVHMEDVVGGDDLLRGTYGIHAFVEEHDYVVGVLGSQIQIVADHDDDYALGVGEMLQEANDVHLMPYIEIGCRFVQQQDLRLLCDAASEHHPLMLTCRQFVEASHRQIGYVHHPHGLLHHDEIVMKGFPFVMRIAPHQDRIYNGHRERVPGRVRNVSDLLGELLRLVVMDIRSVDHHRPLDRREDAVDAMDQSGFPDTVGAYYGNELRTFDGYAHSVEDELVVVVSERQVLCRNAGHICG